MPDFAKRFRKEVTEQIGVIRGKANNGFAEYSLNLEGGNMKASLCPVCNGDGQLKDAIFEGPETTKITMRLCHGCNGKGWVEVQEIHVPPHGETYEFIPFVDRCPACGGDRNSPALTGCPMGSHYGSYCEG